MTSANHSPHPLVRIHHRVRSVGAIIDLAAILALSAPFITRQEYVVLFGLALFYPHLALYRTLRSRDWLAAEFQHVTFDGFLVGLVMRIVHFNPWVSLLMAFQMILNGVVTGGMLLAMKVIAAMVAGVVLTSSLTGFVVAEYTPWLSKLICAVGILAWGVLVGQVVRTNIDRQKTIKQQLKHQSIELEKLNQLLTETVLARFLPPKLVKEIVAGQHNFEDAPKRYSATILFSDLVGFTPLTSDLRASRTARVLNEYLVRMTEVIYAHGGTIAQFTGDGILVIFGVPEEMTTTRQAEQACACALAMHDALDDLNRAWKEAGIPEIRMRIGLHHGPVVAGMFGGDQRSDYTAIGSTVNMAARIQSVCHEGQAFISGELFDYLPESAAEPAGKYHLKGVGEVNLYRLVKLEA